MTLNCFSGFEIICHQIHFIHLPVDSLDMPLCLSRWFEAFRIWAMVISTDSSCTYAKITALKKG